MSTSTTSPSTHNKANQPWSIRPQKLPGRDMEIWQCVQYECILGSEWQEIGIHTQPFKQSSHWTNFQSPCEEVDSPSTSTHACVCVCVCACLPSRRPLTVSDHPATMAKLFTHSHTNIEPPARQNLTLTCVVTYNLRVQIMAQFIEIWAATSCDLHSNSHYTLVQNYLVISFVYLFTLNVKCAWSAWTNLINHKTLENKVIEVNYNGLIFRFPQNTDLKLTQCY